MISILCKYVIKGSNSDGSYMPDKDFTVVLTPHRSLGPQGFFILMALICTVSFVEGVFFLTIGAWPVAGFFVLDVLLVYGAFKFNYRAGRQQEIIEINGEELKITRVDPKGQSKSWRFNRYWVRVEYVDDRQEEYENNPLILTSHGRALEIAGFLSRDEKCVFSNVLRGALKAK